jgi:hypothetical protein
MLLTLTVGLAVFTTLNNNPSFSPFIPTTNTLTQKNGADASSNLTNIFVLRTISINNYGIATITDTFTVRNDGTEYATSADIFYPENIWPKLLTSTAWYQNLQLNTEEVSSGGRNGTRIIFHKSLAPGENTTFTLTQYFNETITIVEIPSIGNMAQFDFLASPYSPYKTEQCNVSVTLPKGAQAFYSPTTYNISNIEPFDASNIITILFYFTDGESIVSLNAVYRQITVDPWLGITVTEFHLIENKGPSSLTKLHLLAPLGTIKFMAYDPGGMIGFWLDSDSVIISTRYPVPPNGTYGFYAVYSIPITMSQVGSSGSYLFAFNILPNYNAIIKNFYVSLIFSNFADLSILSPPAIPLPSTAKNVFFYAWNNVFPTQNIFSYVTYRVGLPTTYLRPCIFMLIFGCIATAYVAIRSRRVEAAPEIVTPAEVVAPLLGEFCELYDERNSLILEMDRLREDALKRKIKKVEYAQRVKSAEKELATLNKQIDQKKAEILQSNKKFESDFKALEINEADREQAKMALQHLRRRYLMKRLTKETYLKLTEVQEKKLKKAESNIDKKIQDLRREAS